jgi:hypothetical protein
VTTTVAFFLVVFAAACLMPFQSDTWWHLRAGQEMWSRRFVMLHDEFSFTVAGTYWPNHEWLSEVVFYGTYRLGGLPGMTLLGATALTAALALSWRLMRVGPTTRLLFMAAAIPSIAHVWTVRPHVFTLLLLMVVVHLIIRRVYWPLPALFVLWANLHGGVALGLVVLGAVTLADGWLAGRPTLLRMLALCAVCFAATFVTPLGVGLWTTIPESIQKSMANGIAEWRPPHESGWRHLDFWLIATGLLVAVVVRRRAIATRTDTAIVCAALALLPLALRSSRNITPFVLLAGPALGCLLPLTARASRRPRVERPGVNAALLGGVALTGAAVVAASWSVRAERLGWDPISSEVIDAVQRCPGRLYNRFDDGGYLIWFAPRVPVFVDNRQDPYPLSFLQEHLHHEQAGNYEEVFARYQVACAFLPPESPTARRLLANGWRTDANDGRWLVLTSGRDDRVEQKADGRE